MAVGLIQLLLPLGWAAVVLASLWIAWSLFARPMSETARCPHCRYPLDSERMQRCPECGNAVQDINDLYTRRRSRLALTFAFAIAIGGLLAATVLPKVVLHGPWAAVPNALLIRLAPSTLGRQASLELVRRIGSGELSKQHRDVVLGRCDAALAGSDTAAEQLDAITTALAIEKKGDLRAWNVIRRAIHHEQPSVWFAAMDYCFMSHARAPDWMTEELCGILAEDGDGDRRLMALMHLQLPMPGKESHVSEAVLQAIRSKDKSVARTVAMLYRNLNMPLESIEHGLVMMTSDPDPSVRRMAKYALEMDQALFDEISNEIKASDGR